MAEKKSQFPNNDNQDTTKESNLINNIISETNDITELPEGIFPAS